ncbi:hypothetical protein PLESTB_001528800 [Pleodorina starrii]|uniref:Phosphatidate cytidylyltransferase, mitochondrial n=1 Tax=Pleodorina starrii TaxID=330485 RepID=A0A9W6F809_9CHLO|nr:hypothetical protein PLESTM_001164800 [Pleodorina starrii]GLC59743.1 hypothetical protein PLESTB_001528800 [Pleodorina starrii]GLC75335.1 hypothetical protein PLESTF_001625100 [Pleodorina starrii]
MASKQSLSHIAAPSRLVSVLQNFPPVTYAFAYGSGAHHQPGLYENETSRPLPSDASLSEGPRADAGPEASSSSRRDMTNNKSSAIQKINLGKMPSLGAVGGRSRGPVIDFIFAVEDAHEWHQQNLARNPDHYSWVGRLGANAICGISEAVGVGVHFNTLVRLDEQTTIKYGVIEAASLERDLALWESCYVAGRLHKPVRQLVAPPPPLAAALGTNLHNAVAAALVLLPPTFTEEELLRTLVGLSYRGDVRLAVGAEDPHKVARIVDGSWDELYGMYLPLLAARAGRYSALGLEVAGQVEGEGGSRRGGRLWRQAKDPESQAAALRLLAPGLLLEMATRLGYHVPIDHLAAGTTTQREVVEAAMRSGSAQRLAADSLAAIVRRSSIYQAASGLLAAGGGKAVQYVGAKVAKALRPLLATATTAAGGKVAGTQQARQH